MELEVGTDHDTDELMRLYQSVGWTSYTDDPNGLTTAVRNSSFVVSARIDGQLVGLARVISDDVSILYVQDVLVAPEHQRQGIGRALLDRCLERFAHVRQRMLLTDDDPHQHRLYEAVGFHDVSKLQGARLHAFVEIVGAELGPSQPTHP